MAGPYVYTTDAYLTSNVMATVEVKTSLGTWHWPVGYAYMYSQFRVDGGEWIRIPDESLSKGVLCWWAGSTTQLFSFSIPGGTSIVETRGAADAYYNVTHKYKETIYGSIRTLTVPPDEDTPWVATRSVYFANDTTINISAEGDSGSYASAVLYMQYREEGGSSSDTGGHNITTLTTHSWDITVTPGVDYEARAALAYNSSIIYGAWYSTKDDIETDDGCIDPPSSGAGILSDPYVITDICQLNWIKTTPNAHYILGNDIDASQTIGWNRGAGFVPIGSSTYLSEPPTLTDPFTGSFNGQGYKIIGLYINRPTWNGAGLFGAVDTTGRIRKVGIVNANITGNSNVGALVGVLYDNGRVSHCYSSGSVTGYGIRIGGLVGWIYGSKVTRSYSSCNTVGAGTEMVGGSELGGLVGDNDYGTISESYATGDVDGGSVYVAGGLVGQHDGRYMGGDFVGKAVVVNCYARGSVTGLTSGGLVSSSIAANSDGSNSGETIIKHSYSTGYITGGSTGGLVAGDIDTNFVHCFWDKETSGQTSSRGGTGETTANMKKETTFTSVGWDFDTLWDIHELINDGYPYFGKSGDEIDVGQLIYLAVPSEKDSGGAPSLDHFSCYDVITRDGQYSDSLVYLEDQFVKVWAIVEEPVLFGNPAKKVHDGNTVNISEPDHHLIFYNLTLLESGEVIQDDFEWGSDGDRIDTSGGDITWQQSSIGTSKAEIDTAQSVSGTRSLRLYCDGTNTATGYFVYSNAGSIKFNMRKDGGAETLIWHGDGTNMIDVRFRSSESFGYGYENGAWTWTQLEVLSIDTWYEVEIKNINWSAATYDIWLDGDELKIGAAMRVKDWASGNIRFSNMSGASECWIDDVYVVEGIQSILDKTVDVENQLSIHTISVSGPVMLAVPTKKGDHSEPSGLDHFLVYDVTGSSPNDTVDVTDQFGTQSNLLVETPTYLAVPTKKTHGSEVVNIVDSVSHLVIYTVSGESPATAVNVVSQVTPEPPIIFTSDVTGLFVRGNEIQVIMSNLGFRSPDFGTNWYALNDLPTDGVVMVGFDANNPQNSFVGCDGEVYVFDNATGQKYNYVKSDLGIISGMTTSIDVDLDGMGALGTDNALHKTLDFGHTTQLWLDEPVTDVSIGGSHVINPSCYFNPAAANDAELSKTDGDYSTAWNGTTGTVYNGDSTLIGQALSETSIYGIYRFGLAFDTTTLSGTIVSAGIRLYVNQVEDGASFNVVVQGDNTYPSNPVVAADYARTKYSGDGGSVASSNILAETHLTIPLNSTGIGWINAGGISRFIIRTDEDINGSAPSANEYIKVNQSEKGSVHAPMLIVTLQTEL